MQITGVALDWADPERVADFGNAVLGWGGVAVVHGGGGAICGPRSGGVYLEFVRVPEPETVKNRVHPGCSAGSLAELDATIERLLRLGGRWPGRRRFAAEVAAEYRNVVLCDPEGNEFCLGGGTFPRNG